MIKVDLWGRMGNQMFQYAFAIETAKKLDTFFTIMPTEKFELVKYFELDFLTRFCFNRFFFRIYKYIIKRFFLHNYITQVNNQSVIIKNNIRYKGFFQSEKYFNNSIDEISKRFKVKRKWNEKYITKYRTLFNDSDKIIVMHIRRTDYVNFGDERVGGKNLCLPMTYYDNCLNLIKDLNQYKIVCISDDIEFVKNYYQKRENYYFFKDEAMVDFQFILNANIAIIANSSFSWWAAFLNKTENKIIYAPKYWFGFKVKKELPENIISKDFLTVEVN